MNTDSKESRIQVTWLTEDFQTVYEVVYGDRSSWKLLMTSKNVTTHESLQEVKEEKTVLSIPYTCTFLECEAYIAAPCHSLYCLIWEMVNESPNKRVHVEKICCQLAKLSRLYYEKPVWELSQEIRDEVDGRRKSLVKLEDDFCLIQSESSVGMNVNAVMSKDFGEKDSSKASCLQPKEDESSRSNPKNRERESWTTKYSDKVTEMVKDIFKNSESKSLSEDKILRQIKLSEPSIDCTRSRLLLVLRRSGFFKKSKVKGRWMKLAYSSFTWREKIAHVLKGRKLERRSIFERIEMSFPEVVKPGWKNNVYKLLKDRCFEKHGSGENTSYQITDENYEHILSYSRRKKVC